jgi:acetate kinase
MNGTPNGVGHILTVNAGSSSLRLASFARNNALVAQAHLSPAPARDPDVLVDFLRQHGLGMPELVMHRVVHGGARLTRPCLLDSVVEAEIARLKTLAPLHNGVALDWIEAARRAFGAGAPHAACFDSGFYAEMPPFAANYALPPDLCRQHELRRYGFHGLAHQSLLKQWLQRSEHHGKRRVISLQIGAGCSATASDHGWPIDTSMGFSPLEGLMMATRCGDLDPAVVLYLIDKAGFSAAELGWIFNESSGLRAVSGQSGDMQQLLDSNTDAAALAIAMFCHRLQKYLGAYLAVLGGADAILFGGGIGERAAEIRARVLAHFEWAGISLDAARNAAVSADRGGTIHTDHSVTEVWVIPTDEAQVMAEAAGSLLSALTSTAQEHVLEGNA